MYVYACALGEGPANLDLLLFLEKLGGWSGRWMDGWLDGWMDEWMDVWMDVCNDMGE